MKKVFTLLFALGALTSVFAQSSRQQSREIILGQGNGQGNGRPVYGNNRGYDNYPNSRNREYQVREINHRYDNMIESVKWDRYLRNREKKQQIRILEARRREELRQVNDRYSSYGRRY
jgi:hypothetical protein